MQGIWPRDPHRSLQAAHDSVMHGTFPWHVSPHRPERQRATDEQVNVGDEDDAFVALIDEHPHVVIDGAPQRRDAQCPHQLQRCEQASRNGVAEAEEVWPAICETPYEVAQLRKCGLCSLIGATTDYCLAAAQSDVNRRVGWFKSIDGSVERPDSHRRRSAQRKGTTGRQRVGGTNIATATTWKTLRDTICGNNVRRAAAHPATATPMTSQAAQYTSSAPWPAVPIEPDTFARNTRESAS